MFGITQMRWSMQLASVVLLLPNLAISLRIGDSSDEPTTMNTSKTDPGLLEEEEDLSGFNNLATDFKYHPKTAKILRQLLAAAAADIYDLSTTTFIGDDDIIKMLSCQEQDRMTQHRVRWGTYVISRSHDYVPKELRGKRILAFRGTEGKTDLITDLSLMGLHNPWSNFGTAARYGMNVASMKRPNFVTGHSLGGAIAEVVAAEKKITGASWNGPSVCSRNPLTNHCGLLAEARNMPDLAKHQFEVWLTREDPVSTKSALLSKTEDAHTAMPHMVSCPEHVQQSLQCESGLPAHGMECMIEQEEIGHLPTAAGCTGPIKAQQCGGGKAPQWTSDSLEKLKKFNEQ